MKLFLSPHNDDECLFAALHTHAREASRDYRHRQRRAALRSGVSPPTNVEESRRACELFRCARCLPRTKRRHVGTREKADLKRRLEPFASQSWIHVYAPAIQGGHNDHDALGDVVSLMFFPSELYYANYAEERSLRPKEEKMNTTQGKEKSDRKNRALDCYPSQMRLPQNKRHFEAVRGRPEYLGGICLVLSRSLALLLRQKGIPLVSWNQKKGSLKKLRAISRKPVEVVRSFATSCDCTALAS